MMDLRRSSTKIVENRFVPSLQPNIENRVRKLPKPATPAQAIQPLFEAVSNAFFAVEDRFAGDAGERGNITISVEHLADDARFRVEVTDNGIGLDNVRYEAFCTIDTDFKRAKGGKGIGRLFWLDAYDRVRVESAYLDENGVLQERLLEFRLNNGEQVVPVIDRLLAKRGEPGTTVIFEGHRISSYRDKFPKREDTFIRHFSSHFIADFLIGGGPKVTVTVDGNPTEYPDEIAGMVVGSILETEPFEAGEFGRLQISGYLCRPEASTGLDGNHQLHLLANGRTVESRKIDGLIGLASIERGDHEGLFFHGCLAGEYLDDRVNEGRTAFNMPEAQIKDLARTAVEQVKSSLLADDVEHFQEARRVSFEEFVLRHPIYGFEDTDTQLDRLPFSATKPEDFATGLVRYQIRRDEERQHAIQRVIYKLDSSEDVPEDFSEAVIKAAENLQRSEQLALAQHVVRRKLVLDLMEKLIRRIRVVEQGPDKFHLERTLHSLICPMNVRGDERLTLQSRAHDLWIVDERLAFTRAFSSDKRLDKILGEGGSADRPDLFVWDVAYGLGVIDPYRGDELVDTTESLKKVMIVEFKHPGRREYKKVEDQIENQINRYLRQLKGGEIETFGRERARIAEDCIFFCYVIADIEGDLKDQLATWDHTANREGRYRNLSGDFRGMIEVIQWRDLVNDAWMRNQATLHQAGLRRS